MAGAEHHHGEMEIKSQKAMWDGFMTASAYGAFLTLLLVGFLTFVFAMSMNWIVALFLCVIAGAGIGMVMGLGAPWIIAMIAFAGTIIFSRIVIALFALFL